MDERLQHDRRQRGRKTTYQAMLSDLPDGTFVELHGQPWLLHAQRLHLWTPGGYTRTELARGETVTVLTPRATVDVLRAGYVAALHPTVGPPAHP